MGLHVELIRKQTKGAVCRQASFHGETQRARTGLSRHAPADCRLT